jgi:hypothetical protein
MQRSCTTELFLRMMMAMADFVVRFLFVAVIAVLPTLHIVDRGTMSATSSLRFEIHCHFFLSPCNLLLLSLLSLLFIVLCFLAFVCIETCVFSLQVCVVAKVAMIHNKISSIVATSFKYNI